MKMIIIKMMLLGSLAQTIGGSAQASICDGIHADLDKETDCERKVFFGRFYGPNQDDGSELKKNLIMRAEDAGCSSVPLEYWRVRWQRPPCKDECAVDYWNWFLCPRE